MSELPPGANVIRLSSPWIRSDRCIHVPLTNTNRLKMDKLRLAVHTQAGRVLSAVVAP